MGLRRKEWGKQDEPHEPRQNTGGTWPDAVWCDCRLRKQLRTIARGLNANQEKYTEASLSLSLFFSK